MNWLKRFLGINPKKPASYQHELLLDRVFVHVSDMDQSCVDEMNWVFEKHYNIRPIKTRHLPYVGDD